MGVLAGIGGLVDRYGAAIRYGIRVAVAGLLSYAIATSLGLAQGYWAVFTTVIVIQASVGASLKASVDRLIGTLCGAIYGGAIAWFLPHGDPWLTALALALALPPLGLLAALDERFRVAPVTAVILLLVPALPGVGPIEFTGDRILEIAIGGVVAVAVAVVVLPSRAHGLLTGVAARFCTLLAQRLPALLGDLATGVDTATATAAQAPLRSALAKLEAAASEARRERQVHLTSDPDPDPVVRTAMRLRNDLIIVGRAVSVPFASPIAERLTPFAAAVAATGSAFLEGIGTAFRERRPAPPADAFQSAVARFHEALAAIRVEGLTRTLPTEAVGRLFTLDFAIDQFARDMGDLAARANEFAGAAPPGEGEAA